MLNLIIIQQLVRIFELLFVIIQKLKLNYCKKFNLNLFLE